MSKNISEMSLVIFKVYYFYYKLFGDIPAHLYQAPCYPLIGEILLDQKALCRKSSFLSGGV